MFTYTTRVRIVPSIIRDELTVLEKEYRALDPSGDLRKTKKEDSDFRASQARSAFSKWNNLKHFYLRLKQKESPKENIPILRIFDDGSVLIEVVASAKGNSTRIYFKPSITSLTKEVRKAIIPINEGNVFIYSDIKAAEFALRAIQAQDSEALETYHSGEDIYMHFKSLFPEGTPRKVIKTILIANMYGKTSYSVSKDLGCSENVAKRLLEEIAILMPKFQALKRKIAALSLRKKGYFAPFGFDQTKLVKVADFNPIKGFDSNLAWSVYTQSALGFIMQNFTKNYLMHQKGVEQTFLSVFDSVICEINPNSEEKFKEFFVKEWAPLLPDEFKIGTTMYNTMYGE